MQTCYIIKRNDERYPAMAKSHHPESVWVIGTLEQTKWVAELLSNCDTPGCDYFYYVKDEYD